MTEKEDHKRQRREGCYNDFNNNNNNNSGSNSITHKREMRNSSDNSCSHTAKRHKVDNNSMDIDEDMNITIECISGDV